MAFLFTRSLSSTVALLGTTLLAACGAGANQPETAASPAVVMTRRAESTYGESGISYITDPDDRSVIGKVSAPTAAVWAALLATLEARQIKMTLLERAAGRVGDTAWVMMRRWNGEQLSTYLSCGSNMTGQRANEERVHAVLLAQLTKFRTDTVAIAVHFSAYTQPIQSGNSGSPAQCTSTGRVEMILLDDVIKRVRAGK